MELEWLVLFFICFVLFYLLNRIIFPNKMTPIHKVWSWSLGEQGVILIGAGIYFHSMINFCWALVSPKCNFPYQDNPHPKSLEMESRRTRGHPDRSWDVQDMIKMSWLEVSLHWIGIIISPRKVSWVVVVGGTVKITSAPGTDHPILNWNRLEWLKIDLNWTRNGPGLDLDLDLSLTKGIVFFSVLVGLGQAQPRSAFRFKIASSSPTSQTVYH